MHRLSKEDACAWVNTDSCSFYTINENTVNISDMDIELSLFSHRTELLRIGAIIDCIKGDENSRVLHEYLLQYSSQCLTSPIFEISHETKGKHLIVGSYPGVTHMSNFLRYHPLLAIVEEYNIKKLYTPIKYKQKSGFNFKLQELITAVPEMKMENLNLVDEKYKAVNREFHGQCSKLFGKILKGNGFLKKLPVGHNVFVHRWNSFVFYSFF